MNSDEQASDFGATNLPTVTPDPASMPPGFGPYRLLRRLGEGAVGEVWLAEQSRPVRRQVAIKIVKAGMDSAQVVARFEGERQALAVLAHPTIAKVFDGGNTPNGRPYFAMEYVAGEPITTYCERKKLPLRERLTLFAQLCEGVQHAHLKGIIHRDLKPSNVLVAVIDDRPIPRIIDFGIAKAVTQPLTDSALFTEVGGVLGTPEYMSPEQAGLDGGDIDTRADIYSLGVMLYELLTGQLPFDSQMLRAASIDELRRTIREVDPPKPSLSAAADAHRLRGDLDWIVVKALEKDRARRYQTAHELALDVSRYLADEPVSAGPPTASYRVRKFVRRHRAGVAVSVSVVLALVVFSVVLAVQARRLAAERDRANQEATTARAVSDFIVNLFRVSDPSEARGRSLTAREILDSGAKQLESSLEDQPAVRVRLQTTIGTVYSGLGLYRDAQAMLERSLASQRTALGADDPQALNTAHELANAHWYLGQYDAAEPLYADVLERRRRTLGADHADTLKTMFDLAALYFRQRRFDEFKAMTIDVLERQRRTLGNTHPDTLSSLNNLCSAYTQNRSLGDPEPICGEVLETRQRTLGNDHPDTLRSLHNVGVLYAGLGRLEDSARLLGEAVEARRRVLGPTHPLTAASLQSLGRTYIAMQRYRDAEGVLLAAFEILSKSAPSDARLPATRAALSELYTRMNDPARAAEWR